MQCPHQQLNSAILRLFLLSIPPPSHRRLINPLSQHLHLHLRQEVVLPTTSVRSVGSCSHICCSSPRIGIRPNVTCLAYEQAMLMQVLSLTPQQIEALPPNERATIQQLVSYHLTQQCFCKSRPVAGNADLYRVFIACSAWRCVGLRIRQFACYSDPVDVS